MLDLSKELSAAKKAAKKTPKKAAKKAPKKATKKAAKKTSKKTAKKKGAKTAAPKKDLLVKFQSGVKSTSAPATEAEHEGDVSHTRKAAKKEDTTIGGWTLHHDEGSGGVSVTKGKSVHIFTGKMAKASAVAFANNHSAAESAKKAKAQAKEALNPEEEVLAKGLIDALKAAKKGRPQFVRVNSSDKEAKADAKAKNAAMIEAFRLKHIAAIQDAIDKADKAKVGASFWKAVAKDKDFYLIGVSSGKVARKKVEKIMKGIESDATRAKRNAEEIHGIF
jgi:hypothetical protein